MIPLHVHSFYSLLTGIIRPDDLILSAKNFNLSSIALTDNNGMYGLIPFYKAAIENNIKPVLGTCITDPSIENNYALLLAKNLTGYSELCKIPGSTPTAPRHHNRGPWTRGSGGAQPL
ncbi:MAG: PHP domain-containing protein, partial [Ignavibacteriaceae bacterium]